MENYFCEKCEQEKDETCFTMDENGEVCDSCCQAWGDLQYENWREREMEGDMSGASDNEEYPDR